MPNTTPTPATSFAAAIGRAIDAIRRDHPGHVPCPHCERDADALRQLAAQLRECEDKQDEAAYSIGDRDAFHEALSLIRRLAAGPQQEEGQGNG